MEELDKKIIELNNKINALDARISFLEIINKKNHIKKIIYYSVLVVGTIATLVISYFIYKSTYSRISSYFE